MSGYNKDVEYCVDALESNEKALYTHSYDVAAARALALAMAHGGTTLDVLVYTEDGARAYGGDDAVLQYQRDPEASVFERYEIKANCVGSVQ